MPTRFTWRVRGSVRGRRQAVPRGTSVAYHKSQHSNGQQVVSMDFRRREEALQTLQHNRESDEYQEDSVDETSKHLVTTIPAAQRRDTHTSSM